MTVVREFHEAFDLARRDTPGIPDAPEIRLRMRLIEEEFKEVMLELRDLLHTTNYEGQIAVLGRLLKELCDLRYVVEGTAVSFGLPIEEAYVEVHRSNMSKLGADGKPIHDAGGKAIKGPNYTPADMGQFVHVIEGDATILE